VTVLVGGLRVLGANADAARRGGFIESIGVLSSDHHNDTRC
jgi:catalase (peroxidase I)